MSKLVDELKREHEQIADVLGKVSALGITNSQAQKLLLSVKTDLLAHLKKEDEQLYPVLRKEAENNEDLKHTLDIFAKDMEIVSQVALNFFDKYSSGGEGIEFGRDFGRLFSSLSTRIIKEENTLYAKYNQIVDN